jgi:hypothetical protein
MEFYLLGALFCWLVGHLFLHPAEATPVTSS